MNNQPIPQDNSVEYVTLNDENGNELKCELLDMVPYKGEKYAVLLSPETDDDEGEVLILQLKEDPLSQEKEMYLPVESEELEDEIFEIFRKDFEDEFEF